MKKLILILTVATLFSCNNFLDEVDQDKLIPEKTDHYSALLLNEFNYNYPLFKTVDYMTDNVTEDPAGLDSRKLSNKTTYTWQREIEIDENGKNISSINNSWEYMYEDIAVANYVIELVDDALGEEQDNNYVKGEAYFIRAFSYFNLLNLYGQPYDVTTANVDLGVPLREDIGVEITYNRNTVAECYAAIESDLLAAIELIDNSSGPLSVWHPDLETCYLLMSRVKLYQEQWDEVITYADMVINKAPLSRISESTPFVTEDNPEILFSFYATSPAFNLINYGTTLTEASYRVDNKLIALYDAKDRRKDAFFLGIDDGTGKKYYRTKKYERDLYTSLGFANFRVGEAYLNRAEAYVQKGDVTNGINDIKSLHSYRLSDTSSQTYPTSQEDALAFVLEERRRELCFEDHHRWFDLRRMKNRPEIKHVYTLVEENGTKLGTETYTLFPDDLNYTLPIPIKERQNNPLIRNNERYEKIPEVNEEIILDKSSSTN
ncbi:RagB/SusD family nutrient uptake outer membrane protein [Robertkochia solimangrovi]|uniref:RagB/SusD family nutrient uptake outer membrane protein n=1 Tax=Robertkochia solimangrovi TaxID=2213046 RepID=UPI00117BF4F3|nr:RagB/SusD family nutrient uptake outer membrane protein [Robertkochia solimangrovi]TRZ45071.1 hypothetical protein DMZ48_04785 [Robertkochia solimangrovi]